MRNRPPSEKRVEFGPFLLDQAAGKLSKQGTAVRLRGMPMKILQHLVERPGQVVSRVELQTLLWNGTAFGDFEQGLNSAVNVLRKTLNDSADQPRYVETVPGQGYRFIAPLRDAPEAEERVSPDLRPGAASAGTPPETPAGRMARPPRWRLQIAAALTVVLAAGVAWRTWRPKPQALIGGQPASVNREANDQYDLAISFLSFQNDIPLARKTFERALALDPNFAAARLQRATLLIVEIYNGYSNDEKRLIEAEEDLHLAERALPAGDGLLLAAQTAVYLAQGRLDRIPAAKVEEWWRTEGKYGAGHPAWVLVLQMLAGKSEEPRSITRSWLERNPMDNVGRMFLGELLRTQGETAEAVRVLERALQQGPRHLVAAWPLAMAYLDQGKKEQARGLLERMRPEFEKNYVWRHAWAILLAAEGKRQAAQEAMDEETLKFARLTWIATAGTADFYALQGDPSKAIEWLQTAVSRGDERVAYFRRNPRLASLRKDARFQSLLRAVEARK